MSSPKSPGKHWSPIGKRPSYSRAEMADAQNDSPLAIFENFERGIKVEVEYIGEGFEGDFDPSDPQDKPLLRFRVFDYTRPEDDYEVDTYCTQIPATTPVRMLHSFACELVRRLVDEESWKSLLQEWSWTDEAAVRRIHAARETRNKKGKK